MDQFEVQSMVGRNQYFKSEPRAAEAKCKMKGRFDVPPQNYCPRDFKAFKMTSLDPSVDGLMRCDDCDFQMSGRGEITEHIQSTHKEILKRVFAKEVLRLQVLRLQIISNILNG